MARPLGTLRLLISLTPLLLMIVTPPAPRDGMILPPLQIQVKRSDRSRAVRTSVVRHPIMPGDELMTVAKIAELFKINQQTVRN